MCRGTNWLSRFAREYLLPSAAYICITFYFADHEEMDGYIPPPAVAISNKETRGKSPVMPSYRKPPPYVSP